MGMPQLLEFINIAIVCVVVAWQLADGDAKLRKAGWGFTASYLVCTVLDFGLLQITPKPMGVIFMSEILKSFIPGFLFYIYRKSTRYTFYYWGYFAIFRLLSGMCQMVISFVTQMPLQREQASYDYPRMLLNLVVLIPAVLAGIFLMKKKILEKIPYKGYVTICISLFLVEFLMGSFSMEEKSGISETIISIIYMCFSLTCLVWGYLFSVQNQSRRTRVALEQIVMRQYVYYHSLKEQEQALRKIQHDLANHMQVIRHLPQDSDYRRQLAREIEAKKESWSHEESEIQTEKSIYKNRAFTGSWRYIATVILLLGNLPIVVNLRGREDLRMWIVLYHLLVAVCVAGGILWTSYLDKKKTSVLEEMIEEGQKQKQEWRCLDEKMMQIEKLQSAESSVQIACTGNAVCDAMLANKRRLCEQKNIVLSLNIHIPPSGINPVSIVGVMGNMLDNAIEACERQTSGAREIHLKTYMRGNFWILSMTNTMPEEADPKADAYKTRKADAGRHGFGLQIMREITETYDGVMKLEQQGGHFYTQIMLRVS